MKIIITILLFILMNFISAFAQINKNSPCPAISVISQSFMPKSGEPMAFTATLSEQAKMYDIKYIWTVSRGKILAGQGTPAIKTTWENPNHSILVNVEIKGLPESCEKTASEIMNYEPPVQPEKIFESSLSNNKLLKVKNDMMIDSLKADPSAQLFVVFYFKESSSQNSIDQKIKRIENYLIDTNLIDKDRISKVKTFSEKQEKVQFWLVPSGVMPPTPEK